MGRAKGKAKGKAKAKALVAKKTKTSEPPPKATTKATAKAKATADATPRKKATTASAAVAKALPSKFPPVNRKTSVYWNGGRLYVAKGDQVRAYCRKKDRGDKRFVFKAGNTASLRAAWLEGCHAINDDPRPRS